MNFNDDVIVHKFRENQPTANAASSSFFAMTVSSGIFGKKQPFLLYRLPHNPAFFFNDGSKNIFRC